MNDQLPNENRPKMVELFKYAPMKKAFGMELHYNQEGSAIFQMPYQEKFNHTFGSVHGGVLSTLLDNAGWFTVAPYYENWITTVDLQVQFLKTTSNLELRSIGHIIKVGKSISFARMEVFDSENKMIASGSGTFSVTTQKIDLDKFIT